MRRLLPTLAGLILLTSCLSPPRLDLPVQEAKVHEPLVSFLKTNHMSPEEYVLKCFQNRDIVFLGEQHWIRHDVALVQDLIPKLHAAGIYNLGTEFACHDDQAEIDRLLGAETYDENLARKITFDQFAWWGYQDYVDIYRAAWRLNRSLPPGARAFRIVGLNTRADWKHVRSAKDREDPAIIKKVWPQGDSDLFMGNVILKEIARRGEKALIYSGMHHAFTRFQGSGRRAGNVVRKEIGDRCWTFFLHASWPSREGWNKPYTYPADGAIDTLMTAVEPQYQRAGFDVTGSPFAKLTGNTSIWSVKKPDFTLGDYCDGYIIQGPLSQYQGVRVAKGFINSENLKLAIEQSPNPSLRKWLWSTAIANYSLRKQADISNYRKRYR